MAIGSGAGIRQFTAGLVDFAASDAAMSDDEIKQVERGVVMLPMTAGSIALAYNLPDAAGELNLSRKNMVGIFLGQIKHWDDSALTLDNPNLSLPHLEITVVRRSEGSGTAVANCRERLQLLYGAAASLELGGRAAGANGTLVRLTFPVERGS